MAWCSSRSSMAAVSTASPAKAWSQRAEGQVRGQDHRALLVALGDDLEEQVGLLAAERQVADLVDDQELVDVDGAVHRLLQPALALRRLQGEDQIGRGGEAHLPAALRGEVAERDRQVRLADAAGPEQHDVLGALDEGEAGELLDLRARRAGGEGEVEAVERLDRREAGDARQTSRAPGRAARRARPAAPPPGSRRRSRPSSRPRSGRRRHRGRAARQAAAPRTARRCARAAGRSSRRLRRQRVVDRQRMLQADDRPARRRVTLRCAPTAPAIRRRYRLQRSALDGQPLGRDLAGRAVHARVRHLAQPSRTAALAVCAIDRQPVLRAAGSRTARRSCPQVADEALDLALGLRPVGAAQPRPEAAVLGEVEEAGVEAVPTAPVARRARSRPCLHVVVEHLARHAAEAPGRRSRGGDQRLDALVGRRTRRRSPGSSRASRRTPTAGPRRAGSPPSPPASARRARSRSGSLGREPAPAQRRARTPSASCSRRA